MASLRNGKQAGGRIEYVRIFFVVAVLVLVIASINFMNLTTAQSSKRAKEVGTAQNGWCGQIAACVSISCGVDGDGHFFIFVSGCHHLPDASFFQRHSRQKTSLDLFDGQPLIIFCFGYSFFTGLVSGSYPALYISGFNPASVLKGQMKSA